MKLLEHFRLPPVIITVAVMEIMLCNILHNFYFFSFKSRKINGFIYFITLNIFDIKTYLTVIQSLRICAEFTRR